VVAWARTSALFALAHLYASDLAQLLHSRHLLYQQAADLVRHDGIGQRPARGQQLGSCEFLGQQLGPCKFEGSSWVPVSLRAAAGFL